MTITSKIIHDAAGLAEYVATLKKQHKTISLCHGHFNVIHPGHMRFLEFAKKHSDILIVAVHGPSKIDSQVRSRFYGIEERSRGVASLEYVDRVFIFDDMTVEELINAVKPSAYVLGEEFAQQTEKIQSELNAVERAGGKVIFSAGESYSMPTEYLVRDLTDIQHERRELFHQAIQRQNISIAKLKTCIDSFPRIRMLVIGDTIVDQYVACDPLGLSSEAPVMVIRELENKEFIGGAAVVARHVRAFGVNSSFVSLLGNDAPAALVRKELAGDGIRTEFAVDDDRPTTFKIRYMVGPQKLLRVTRLKEHHLNQKMEEQVIAFLTKAAPDLDGIIVSDFGYGVITPGVLDHLAALSKKHKLKLFGDSQSSSQIGDVSKFKGYWLLTPTEREARIALADKYSGLEKVGNNLMRRADARNLLLKLGPEGFIAFARTENEYFVKTQHFPALNPYPIDVMGAGDSLLTGTAIAMCAGADLMEASVIGAVTASIAVSKMGNIPVTIAEIRKELESL